MPIKRIVPNIASGTPRDSIGFYEDFLGLKVAMDMDWIITFISDSNPTSQVSVIRSSATPSGVIIANYKRAEKVKTGTAG